MEISQIIKENRKMKNLSQEELAKKMHISRQSISKWETENHYQQQAKLSYLVKFSIVLWTRCSKVTKRWKKKQNMRLMTNGL